MMDENRPEGQNLDERFRPEHSPRTWRACCLAPTVAAALVLILAFGAGLLGPRTRFAAGRKDEEQRPDVEQRRQAFIELGQSCFEIADRADQTSEKAFGALERMVRKEGSLDQVHQAFKDASAANGRASTQFRSLPISPVLVSESKIRKSLDTLSQAYDGRRRICDMLVAWDGNVENRTVIARYQTEAEDVNRLTTEGLKYLGEAAGDNELTREDIEKFAPPAPETAGLFGAFPWTR
jgi:hypothetical protein